MLIECPMMAQYRETCGLGPYITAHRRVKPQISSLKIFALYLNDRVSAKMQKKAIDLYHMKLGWHKLMQIDL
jgi:hypothetical protein